MLSGPARGAASRELVEERSWSRAAVRRLVAWGTAAGLTERVAGGVRLTAAGRQRAEQLVRMHRLWELFLISGADIAPDHVDRDADSIEHFLTPEIIAALEEQLGAQGYLPPVRGIVPDSPHELPASITSRPVGQEPASD